MFVKLAARIAACLLAGCAHDPGSATEGADFPPLSAGPFVRPLAPRDALKAPKRPFTLRSIAFDHRALPPLAPASGPARRISLSLVEVGRLQFRVDVDPGLAVLLDEEGMHAASWNQSASPLSFGMVTSELGGPKIPMEARMERSSDAACVERRSAPRVTALAIGDWDRDGVRVETLDTFLEKSSRPHGGDGRLVCRGTAVVSATVRAKAILPNLLYAFRRADAGGEELVVIGPPSEWSAASAEPAGRRQRWSGPFSLLSIPVARGSSASLLLSAGYREIAYFVGLYGRAPAWVQDKESSGSSVTFSVEVLWPEGQDAPEARVVVQGVDRSDLRLLDARPVAPPLSLRPE